MNERFESQQCHFHSSCTHEMQAELFAAAYVSYIFFELLRWKEGPTAQFSSKGLAD